MLKLFPLSDFFSFLCWWFFPLARLSLCNFHSSFIATAHSTVISCNFNSFSSLQFCDLFFFPHPLTLEGIFFKNCNIFNHLKLHHTMMLLSGDWHTGGKTKLIVKTLLESNVNVIVNWSERLQNLFQWKIPQWTSRSWLSHSILILNKIENGIFVTFCVRDGRGDFSLSRRGLLLSLSLSLMNVPKIKYIKSFAEKNDYKNVMWLKFWHV